MWFRKLVTLAMLAIAIAGMAGSPAEAQITGVQTRLPWNSYRPFRIPDAFTTIIGVPGTTMITNSQTATSNQVFNLPLPFAFRFLSGGVGLTTYAQGYSLRVGANGYISFGGTTGSGVPHLGPGGVTIALCPYWSDIEERNVIEGGIFWRVDGAVGARILTVEWRAQGVPTAPPTRNPGQFQAKLFETSNKVEFFYGSNSIDRSTSFPTEGAFVGLKNQGFPDSPFPPAANNDEEKFLMLLNPDMIRDTIALTRTRAGQINEPWPGFGTWVQTRAEINANWHQNAGFVGGGPYWHYSFPTQNGARIGYRISPVVNDAAPDSVWLTPSTPGNAYLQNSVFQLHGRFRNWGQTPIQNVAVQADIYRGNTFLESRTGVAFPTATPGGEAHTIDFVPPIGPPVTVVPGTYTIRVYTKMTSPVDEDRNNDTMTIRFFISFPFDAMTYDILDPDTYTIILPTVYTVGVPLPIEVRYLNIGTMTVNDVEVGYTIYDINGSPLFTERSTVRGAWDPLEFRDVVFEGWTPTSPGQFFIRAFTNLGPDQQRSNDTLPPYPSNGKDFYVRYEIEVEARQGGVGGTSPTTNGDYPDARPINLRVAYVNNGITDATNVPARVEIRKGGCTAPSPIVYSRSQTITTVPGESSGLGTAVYYDFPFFIPNGPGLYCVTSIISDPSDPVRNNDTVRWTFTVKPRLTGIIRVGLGERFRTIQEANDSLYRYGINGNVTFELVDDAYTVRPSNNDRLLPALDGRGDVIGSGPNAIVTWRPVAGKTNVDIRLKSPSGIGVIYGQRDTTNPTGYQVWDGGPNRIIRFIMDTAGAIPPTKMVPFFFSQGSSNFTLKNLRIEPATVALGMKNAISLPIVRYNRAFNAFSYEQDESSLINLSTAIFVRNHAPADINGRNPAVNGRFRDTLRNQNNSFDNLIIRNFGYGIVSLGAGPLYRTGEDAFIEYNNQNNQYVNNLIEDVTRSGIAVAFEKNSVIGNNTIRRVNNTNLTYQHAAGIWIAGGGFTGIDTFRNRGYADNIRIERNRISVISTAAGNGVGIWAETGENVFTSTARVFRFPANGATNHTIQNNMVWNYQGKVNEGPGLGYTIGIGQTMAGETRIDFVTRGNKVENNTLFNQVAATTQEVGLVAQRAQGSIRNNIFAILTPAPANPTGIFLQGPDILQNVNSDYNIFWVPNGNVGAASYLATSGFNIPSPPVGKTLNQWRALTGLDQNSIEGNITTEFVSITPGSENLHIRPNIIGSLANNRGVNIPGLTVDIDNDPRGAAAGIGRYDIGADEFAGIVRNNDVVAEDVLTPFGYRAPTGQYSDAEYAMIDSVIPVSGRFRNIGGLPQVANTVKLDIAYYNGVSWISSGSATITSPQTTAFDVAQSKNINFGVFAPRSLDEVNVNDAFYGESPNVSPLYRFTITSGTDDYLGNNVYEKTVRFFVRRSHRAALVSVETRQVALPGNAIGLSNKLNADTLLAALDSINWERANGTGLEDFDLFDRDKWPKENLNFKPWKTVIWAQGAEPQGLEPEERAALKAQLESRSQFDKANLIIAGEDVAPIHDVELTASNGMVADRDFVRNYLRGEFRSGTVPPNYSNRLIRGVVITPSKYERIQPTGVVGDNAPFPSVLRPTVGDGIARATHHYTEQTFGQYTDSVAGVVSASQKRNVIYYAIDWRHYGRFTFEADRSGAQRLLLAALDFTNQNGGVVPVNITTFDAYQSGRKSVRVDWETAAETDVASLEIERALVTRTEQGEREGVYSVVERRSPAGSATRGAKYTIVDPNVEAGAEYRYRLVSVGLDGSRTVEAVDQVKVSASGVVAGFSMSIQPNPARTQATIELRVPDSKNVRVELYDASGRLVQTLENGNVQDVAVIELNVENLASGMYTVRMKAEGGIDVVQKLTVQK